MIKFKTNLNKIFLVFFLSLSLIIAGCSEGSGNGSTNSGELDQYRGGVEHVKVELESGSPPEVVYDDSTFPFDIILRIENTGEWDIEPNSLRMVLEGFSSQRWGEIQDNFILSNQLIGYDSFFDIEGDFEYVSFDNIEYKEPLTQNTFTHNYRVRTCYPYGTRVAFTACINNDARRSSDDDSQLCEGFSQRDFSVSSGPLGVDLVEQQVVNGRLRLIFTINQLEFENDEVTLYSPQSLDESCNLREGIRETQVENNIKISLRDTVVGEFSCSSEGEVRFPTSQRKVTCEADISNLETQEIPMVVNLEYEVEKSFRDSILVERSN